MASLFHSQQAAEKAVKAFLALNDIPFRKTHDLVLPGLQCIDLDPTLEPLLELVADLTDYASAFRYPDAEEAVRAVEIAENLCGAIRGRIAS